MEEELKAALQVAVTALTRIVAGADGPAYYIAKAALEEIQLKLREPDASQSESQTTT